MLGVQEGRKILQYPRYGQSIGGAAVDNNVGWSNADANGYSVVEGVTCAAGEVVCHGRYARHKQHAFMIIQAHRERQLVGRGIFVPAVDCVSLEFDESIEG